MGPRCGCSRRYEDEIDLTTKDGVEKYNKMKKKKLEEKRKKYEKEYANSRVDLFAVGTAGDKLGESGTMGMDFMKNKEDSYDDMKFGI